MWFLVQASLYFLYLCPFDLRMASPTTSFFGTPSYPLWMVGTILVVSGLNHAFPLWNFPLFGLRFVSDQNMVVTGLINFWLVIGIFTFGMVDGNSGLCLICWKITTPYCENYHVSLWKRLLKKTWNEVKAILKNKWRIFSFWKFWTLVSAKVKFLNNWTERMWKNYAVENTLESSFKIWNSTVEW